MLEVDVHAGLARLLDVARDDLQFGVLRDSRHAELAGNRAVVDRTGVVMLAMLDEIQAGLLDVGEHLVEEAGRHRGPVVADGGDRVGQLPRVLAVHVMAVEMAQPVGRVARLDAGAVLGGAYAQVVAHRQRHVVHPLVMLQVVDDVAAACVQHLRGTGCAGFHRTPVHGGDSVRHDEYVRVAARRSRPAAGHHGFLIGLAGIAEMHVRIGEAGGDRQPGGIEVTFDDAAVLRLIACVGRGNHHVDDLAGVPDANVA